MMVENKIYERIHGILFIHNSADQKLHFEKRMEDIKSLMFEGEDIDINKSCLIISSQFNRLSIKAQKIFK